jgi:P-type Ca2+ transporter type 2C
MSLLNYGDKHLRVLPGRIRLELKGIKGNPSMVDQATELFSLVEGILKVDVNSLTGRMLLLYDEHHISIEEIIDLVQKFEAQAITLPSNRPSSVPLPLVITMGGLTVLTAKQLIWGKSALAASPVPFYLSSLVSVLSGYPFLKRGVAQFTQERKLNSELLLGTSALALALVRENVVVLAGLSLLQFLNWKKDQTKMNEKVTYLSAETQAYSEKASKWGMLAAGLTWAFTRNPLKGLAVLIAAHPRPATIPGEYAWKNAEFMAQEKNYMVPNNGSLAQLART